VCVCVCVSITPILKVLVNETDGSSFRHRVIKSDAVFYSCIMLLFSELPQQSCDFFKIYHHIKIQDEIKSWQS
jgi:hypothetical protein